MCFFQGPKRITAKKESKEKRESIEESKENLKAKSDDSGEEKNGDDDSQKNGSKKKGKCLKDGERSDAPEPERDFVLRKITWRTTRTVSGGSNDQTVNVKT